MLSQRPRELGIEIKTPGGIVGSVIHPFVAYYDMYEEMNLSFKHLSQFRAGGGADLGARVERTPVGVFPEEVFDGGVVFFGQQRAGRVAQPAAGPHQRGCAVQEFALQRGQPCDIVGPAPQPRTSVATPVPTISSTGFQACSRLKGGS